jgi:hypothetical protein
METSSNVKRASTCLYEGEPIHMQSGGRGEKRGAVQLAIRQLSLSLRIQDVNVSNQ